LNHRSARVEEVEEEDEERRTQRVGLGRPNWKDPPAYELRDVSLMGRRRPTSTLLKEAICYDELFELPMMLSNQLESAVELSSSLQTQHDAAQSIIPALESKVVSLETSVKPKLQPLHLRCPLNQNPRSHHPDLTQILSD
jgi:hypothetical protein